MSDRFRVTEPSTLLVFLSSRLHNWARSKIKQRLRTGCVTVNDIPVTRHDHPLIIGDEVKVGAAVRNPDRVAAPLEILYSDHDLIAINKPAGLLAVATANENQDTALAKLRTQLSRRSRPVKLWPVHRIDRDTSGVMLFATSREMREAVMALWDEAEKIYLAVVEGCPDPAQGTIDQPLHPDAEEYRMHVGPHPNAKPAITHYQIIEQVGTRTLLQVNLATGRQHQIRAHLAWLGYPVSGDSRYGIAGSRMGLHALRLSITHPVNGRRLSFETPPPRDFTALLG